VAVKPQLVRVRTRVKQESHGFEVSFTDCETQGRILSRQRGIAFEQTTELEHVTVRRSGDRVPHILSAVRVELGWPNHRWHIPRNAQSLLRTRNARRRAGRRAHSYGRRRQFSKR